MRVSDSAVTNVISKQHHLGLLQDTQRPYMNKGNLPAQHVTINAMTNTLR